MQKQEYLPLSNFLNHQAHYCIDEAALKSIQAQLDYCTKMRNKELTHDERAERARKMAHLKARWQATFTDGRPGYGKKLTQPGTVAAFRTFRTTALNEAGKIDLSASTSGVAA